MTIERTTAPDFFRRTNFEVLRLAQMYRKGDGGHCINLAGNALRDGKSFAFHVAMFRFRAYCRDLIALSHSIERKFDEAHADEWEECPTVYAP